MTASKIVMNAASGVGGGIDQITSRIFYDTQIMRKAKAIVCDKSTGDIYTVSANSNAGVCRVTKFDLDLDIQWSKQYSNMKDSEYAYLVFDETNDFLYFTAQYQSTNDVAILRIDPSDGSINSSTVLSDGTACRPRGLALNGDNTILYVGFKTSTTPGYVALNTSNLAQVSSTSDREYYSSSGMDPSDIAFNSVGDDIIVHGRGSGTGTNGTDAFVANFGDGSAIGWQKFLTMTGNVDTSRASSTLGIDGSGNIYHAGNIATDRVYISKLNSSGTEQWTKKFKHPSSGQDIFLKAFVVADDGTSYMLVQYAEDKQPCLFYLISMNADGTSNWDRFILNVSDRNANTDSGAMTLDENDDLLVHCMLSVNTPAVLRIPKNGKGKGLYNNLIYQDDSCVQPSLSDNTYTTSYITGPSFSLVDASFYANTFTGSVSTVTYTTRKTDGPVNLGPFEVVGVFGHDNVGGTSSQTLQLGSGVQSGDYIMIVQGTAGSTLNLDMNSSGYTKWTEQTATDSVSCKMLCHYKKSGGSDTTIVVDGSGSSTNALCAYGVIIRGLHPTDALLSGSSINNQSNTIFANPNSITADSSEDTLAIFMSASSHPNSHDFSMDNADFDYFGNVSANDSYDASAAIGIKYMSAGSGAFDGGANTGNRSNSTAYAASSIIGLFKSA